MAEHTEESIKRTVKKYKKKAEWNHYYEFPFGIKTRPTSPAAGFNVNKWEKLEPLVGQLKTKGKTVLDVGCSDGYFSIKAAGMKTSHVLGIDPDPHRIKKANFAKEVLGIQNVEFSVFDLYDLDESKKFDIVFGFGLIHRVPNMDACLDKLGAIGDNIVLEFKALDNKKPKYEYHGGDSKSNEWNGLYYTPTKQYVIDRMRRKHGFINYYVVEDSVSKLDYKRIIILFTREKIK